MIVKRGIAIVVIMACLFCGGYVIVQGTRNTPVRPNVSEPNANFSYRKQAALVTLTVTRQLKCLRHRDYKGAMRYSAGIYRVQMSPQEFGGMVHSSFPAMETWQAMSVGPVQFISYGQGASMGVALIMSDHSVVRYMYNLENEDAGYRVAGVQPLIPQLSPQQRQRDLRVTSGSARTRIGANEVSS